MKLEIDSIMLCGQARLWNRSSLTEIQKISVARLSLRKFRMLAIAISALVLPQPAFASDDARAIVGRWSLNLAESIPPQGKIFRPFMVEIRESGETLEFTQYETDSSGKTRTFSHRTPTDGIVRELSGYPGAKMAMTRLPSGVLDAQFWFPNGAMQNKICVLERSLTRQKCLATITSAGGEVSFFKQVLDKIP